MTVYANPMDLVKVFHLTYGQPVRTTPQFNVPEKQMRHDLISEEVGELLDAYVDKDFVEVIDALADIVYVVCGAAITHGVDMVVSIERPLFVGPINEDIFAQSTEIGNQFAALNINLLNATTVEELTVNWRELIALSYKTAFSYGIDLDEILDEVQRSNLSKLGEGGVVLRREDGKILKGPNFFAPDIAGIIASKKSEVALAS